MPDSTITLRTRAELQGVQQAVNAYNALDKTQQAAARSAIQLTQNMARVDGALKGPQAEAARLKAALQSAVAIDPRQAVSAINQIAAAERKAANDLGPALPRTLESFGGQAINQLKSGLIGIVGPAAVATAALKAIPAAIDLAQLGAQADLVRIRFDSLAQSSGIAGDALLAALRKGSGREISDLNLQLAANKAQLLGVAHSAEEFGVLMSIARDRAQQMGITTTQAFDDLVTGLGRGSRLILDNLGILVNADEANQAYARSIGKTVSQLTDQERKQALVNQVIKDGQASLAATGGAVDSAAAGQARLGASWDNVKASAGSAISQGVAPFVNSLSDLINMSDGSKENIGSLINGLVDFNRQISGLPPLTAEQTKAQQDWTRAVQDWIIAREVQLGLMDAQPVVSGGGGGGAFEFADVALAREVTEAQLGYADAMALTGVQARAAQLAVEQKSTADKVASIDAQTHGIAEQQLADSAQKAANELLMAGPAGARMAALLAGSSQDVDVLTAALYRLGAAKQAAIGPTSVDRGEREYSTAAELAGVAAASAAGRTEAFRNQILQTGTATQVVTQRQKDYNDAVARFGARSQQAINAQTALIQAQQAANKPKAGSAGGRGLGALDRVDISLAGDYQAQLDAVNAKLAKGNLTELQTKQLKKEQLDLQNKIAEAAERANNAALDARIQAIENRKKDREDAQRLARAQAVLANPNAFSAEQRVNAADLVELLPLEQQKRNNDVAAKAREAGIALPVGAAQVPAGAAANIPSAQPEQQLAGAGAGGTPLILNMDAKQVGTILLPYLVQGLNSMTQQVRAAGG